MKIRNDDFKLRSRRRFKDAEWSVTYAICGTAVFIMCCVFSGINRGNGGLLVGFLGLIGLLLDLTGLILAVKSLRGDEIYFLNGFVGLLLNSLMVIIYIILMIMGFVL